MCFEDVQWNKNKEIWDERVRTDSPLRHCLHQFGFHVPLKYSLVALSFHIFSVSQLYYALTVAISTEPFTSWGIEVSRCLIFLK